MEFKLSITSVFVSDEQKKQYEKLGFQFEPNDWEYNRKEEPWQKKSQPIPILQVNTLEELIGFIQKYGEIVLNKDTIEIYDDYRE